MKGWHFSAFPAESTRVPQIILVWKQHKIHAHLACWADPIHKNINKHQQPDPTYKPPTSCFTPARLSGLWSSQGVNDSSTNWRSLFMTEMPPLQTLCNMYMCFETQPAASWMRESNSGMVQIRSKAFQQTCSGSWTGFIKSTINNLNWVWYVLCFKTLSGRTALTLTSPTHESSGTCPELHLCF